MGGKEKRGIEKANKYRKNGESTYMDGIRPSFLLILHV